MVKAFLHPTHGLVSPRRVSFQLEGAWQLPGYLGTTVTTSGRVWISGSQGELSLEGILRYPSGCGLSSLLCPPNVSWNWFCPSQLQN